MQSNNSAVTSENCFPDNTFYCSFKILCLLGKLALFWFAKKQQLHNVAIRGLICEVNCIHLIGHHSLEIASHFLEILSFALDYIALS